MLKPVPLPIPLHLVMEARLYAPGRSDLDAVCHVLQDYPRLVGEVRQLAKAPPLNAELDDLLAELLELHEGDLGGTLRWLTAPNMALSNERPIELLVTEYGTRAVRQAIRAIECEAFGLLSGASWGCRD
ncbi:MULTISPECIES: MbcA/ParS/Xre antitoxin family protein [unclassified Pseudomonas]|uniref:MbcA/ParS/Xre antitoxin family protein n=1 Tax=unclassified Pseudomonas TaxID=196821 RepID=UPI002447653A|nr:MULTISPECIES: MbcA/ParS/Xre antitoxin family protein [unclassified Pseudomonas]MDG9927321.1 MbcA/ParS/Xre antitoxin family protein [Pseudomonas sp. GD04042]MDH0482390.1 MbcA/ParS/Xre antitoxin family protein [Pseudomonas sp. GD04015]MDH0602742.1 MbcA/ParS/Xre antitoxin family protein [Pseudomonas sp. GD03869]